MLSPTICTILAALTGVALELTIQTLTGRREAWDSGFYWVRGIPVALVVSFAIGFFSRGRGWLGTLAVVPAQVLTMAVTSAEISGLLPVAIALSAMLSAPFVAASFVGSLVGRLRR